MSWTKELLNKKNFIESVGLSQISLHKFGKIRGRSLITSHILRGCLSFFL